MASRVAAQAEADLDEIWLYVAMESGNLEVATRLVESVTSRFSFLAGFPRAGRTRDRDLGMGIRSFAAGEYLIIYCVDGEDVLILRVIHAKRELGDLFAR